MSRENEEIPQIKSLTFLPTNKPHISFSELSDWVSCTWRHQKKHIEKIALDSRSHYLDFGIAIHAACEDYLLTRVMKEKIALDIINDTWKKFSYEEKEGEIANLELCLKQASEILKEVPAWLDEMFPNWELLSAEHLLYEKIEGEPHAFKGYIDAVICSEHVIRKKKKKIIWLLDWKTTSWGWDRKKKQDPHKKRQLIYYKNFWSKKMNVSPKDIKCGFVLLKRTVSQKAIIENPDKKLRCELLTVSVGEVSTKRALDVIDNMLYFVNKRKALKNKYSCDYCEYRETEHCT